MIHVRDLIQSHEEDSDGCWIPAEPYGVDSIWSRLRDAWHVLTGRAVAVTWRGKTRTKFCRSCGGSGEGGYSAAGGNDPFELACPHCGGSGVEPDVQK